MFASVLKKKKKIEFGSGRVRKFWPDLPCLVFAFAKPKRLGSSVFLTGFLMQPRGKKSKNRKAKRC